MEQVKQRQVELAEEERSKKEAQRGKKAAAEQAMQQALATVRRRHERLADYDTLG